MNKTNEIAHFDIIKQQNKKIIRNLLRNEASLSIPQITQITGLTYPTCSGILKELLEEKQVIKESEPTSKGGRPGVNYRLNDVYKYGLIMYFEDWNLNATVYNSKGIDVKHFVWPVQKDIKVLNILDLIKEIKNRFQNLATIIFGVPGVISDEEIVSLPKFPNLVHQHIKEQIEQEFQVEVLLENDLNGMAYAKAQAGESYVMLAYINNCIGAGIVLEGNIYNGNRGFAGEIEILCTNLVNEEQTLAECVHILFRVLDLPLFYIVDGSCDEQIIQRVKDILVNQFKVDYIPKLIFEGDMNACYEQGLLKKIIEKWENNIV